MVEVDWVRAVKVGAWWCTIGIPVPKLLKSVKESHSEIGYTHSTRVVGSVEVEWISALSQTIQVR
jgi:hypothetical protein